MKIPLTPHQNQLLDAEVARVAEAQRALAEANDRAATILQFGMPEGAVSFDMESRTYEVPDAPSEEGPALVP